MYYTNLDKRLNRGKNVPLSGGWLSWNAGVWNAANEIDLDTKCI